MERTQQSNQGQGRVTDPEHDGRLKENRADSRSSNDGRKTQGRNTPSRDEDGQFISEDDQSNRSDKMMSEDDRSDRTMSDSRSQNDGEWEPGKTGRVIDPDHDGRLKENREDGVTLGTTEHSAQAPNVHDKRDDEPIRRTN